jgi:hypothetical protein
MSTAPAHPVDDRAHARTERQLELLGALAEIGLEVARAVERRARDAGPDEDLNAIARAYARAARAVRLTVMLQSRLAKDLDTRVPLTACFAASKSRNAGCWRP